jgi:hypothetical protein
MLKRWLLSSATVGVCVWLVSIAVLQGAKAPSDVSLRAALGSSGGVQTDGAVYVDGESNVRAVLNASYAGNLLFDTNDNTRLDGGRRVWLNFDGQPTPFGSASPFPADVFIGTIPVSETNTDNLITMALNQTFPRRTRINWVGDDGKSYYLAWDGPENDGHDFVTFTCTALSASACSRWTAAPGTIGGSGKAGLYSSVTAKGKTTVAYYGSYDMPFQMTLVKK